MIRIVEVVEIDGEKYVKLEDYQKLIQDYESDINKSTDKDILKSLGEDEVYDGSCCIKKEV